MGREGTSLQWEKHGFLSLWIFCLPTIAYLCRGNSFCDAWGKVCSTVTAFCKKSLHCCTLFVRGVQTLHTHAEQSCSRKMSAHHNWEITNKSVHPEWLLEKMEGWIIQLWFLSKCFSNQKMKNQTDETQNSCLPYAETTQVNTFKMYVQQSLR